MGREKNPRFLPLEICGNLRTTSAGRHLCRRSMITAFQLESTSQRTARLPARAWKHPATNGGSFMAKSWRLTCLPESTCEQCLDRLRRRRSSPVGRDRSPSGPKRSASGPHAEAGTARPLSKRSHGPLGDWSLPSGDDRLRRLTFSHALRDGREEGHPSMPCAPCDPNPAGSLSLASLAAVSPARTDQSFFFPCAESSFLPPFCLR